MRDANGEAEPAGLLGEPRLTRRSLLGGGVLAGAATVAAGAPEAGAAPRTREYWIAAVPVTWNVVPNGHNAIEGETFRKDQTTFRTVVYRAFTRKWRKALPQPTQQLILGPLLRGRVGDRLLVHFKNMDTELRRPHSIHFHGVGYEFGSDGSYIPGFSGRGAVVKPGQSFTYELEALPSSVGVWPYHDHSPSMHESIPGGLYGAVSILGRAQRPPDREFVVFFGQQLGFMTVNGRAFVGNTPRFHARLGDVVQWDVLAIGDDFHTFHVHGHRWRDPDGSFVDTKTLGPADSFAVRWTEDVPGMWLYHCHVESHMRQGMIGLYHARR